MRISKHHAYISFLISALAIPTLVFGANPSPSPSPIVAMDIATASNLLNSMQAQSNRVNFEADKLCTFYRINLGWYGDSFEINQMAYRVRKMDRNLYALRVMKEEDEIAAPQSRIIARITPDVILLTDELNYSIHFINRHQDRMWMPAWGSEVKAMLRTSANINRDMKDLKEVEEASLTPAQSSGASASS